MARVIEAVAEEVAGRQLSHTLRVGIDGCTAVGKTTFADALADALGRRGRSVVRAGLDGFHHPRGHRYRSGRRSAQGYYRDARDLAAVRDNLLAPLGPGGDGRYTLATYDLAHETALEPSFVKIDPGCVLILDGSFLQRPDLRAHLDLIVFLRASGAISRERGLARDAERLGEEAEILYDERYLPAFDLYAAEVQPEANADTVIDVSDLAAPFIVKVKR